MTLYASWNVTAFSSSTKRSGQQMEYAVYIFFLHLKVFDSSVIVSVGFFSCPSPPVVYVCIVEPKIIFPACYCNSTGTHCSHYSFKFKRYFHLSFIASFSYHLSMNLPVLRNQLSIRTGWHFSYCPDNELSLSHAMLPWCKKLSSFEIKQFEQRCASVHCTSRS